MRIIAFQYKADTADVCKHVVYTSRRHKATYLSIQESCFWPPPGDGTMFNIHSKSKMLQYIRSAVWCWDCSVLDTSGSSDRSLKTAACRLMRAVRLNHNSKAAGSKTETMTSEIQKATTELRAPAESGDREIPFTSHIAPVIHWSID